MSFLFDIYHTFTQLLYGYRKHWYVQIQHLNSNLILQNKYGISTSKKINNYIMMRITHVKSRSIFQTSNNSSSPNSDSEFVVQLFWCTVPRRKIYSVPLAKFSRRSLAREAMFGFSISHPHRHACSVYNCFLLLFCSDDSKSSVPFFRSSTARLVWS